jgi:glycerophosphoryl diester phosphodiesterase
MVMPMARFTAETADAVCDLLLSIHPAMVESKFDSLDTLARAASRLAAGGVSVWVNTLDPVASCGMTDSRAVAEPTTVWGRLIDAGVSIIQTDAPEALDAFLARGRSAA